MAGSASPQLGLGRTRAKLGEASGLPALLRRTAPPIIGSRAGAHKAQDMQKVDSPASSRSLITAGLLDGQLVSGASLDFSPHQAQFEVQELGREGKGRLIVLSCDDVAWVAQYPRHGASPVVPPDETMTLTIHVAGGRAFSVKALASDLAAGHAFCGWPAEANTSWECIWFFPHGIVGRERPEPLGALLMRSNQISPEDLQSALASQAQQRAKPIGQILVENRKIDAEALNEAARLQARKSARLGEILVECGLVSQQDVDDALEEQRQRRGRRLGEILVDSGLLAESVLAATLAEKFRLKFVDLNTIPTSAEALAAVSHDVMRKYTVFPVALDAQQLTLVVADPLQTEVHDILRFLLKRRVVEWVAVPSQVRARIAAEVGAQDQAEPPPAPGATIQRILQDMERGDESGGATRSAERNSGPIGRPQASGDKADKGEKTSSADDASEGGSGVVRLIDEVIREAQRIGASDIHVEQYGPQEPMTLRVRVDGQCRVLAHVPGKLRNAVVARLKIMADLDISERRKPQDGKIVFKAGEGPLELRMATLPTVPEGEDVVLRLLAASKPLPVEKMGFSPRNLAGLRSVMKKPYGLILCVGPTGSGKTTTLHSVLGELNTDHRKIWTAEDPVEITQAGLRQVQMHARIGLTFATAMRAFLRADPDVIMVGEMRDHETAATAVEASLTGHLVLSTLHTNSAPETVTRLLDMGIDPFSFADSLEGVLAQRLARRLCGNCKKKSAATPEERQEFESLYGRDALLNYLGPTAAQPWLLGRAVGCDTCGGTGYKGRVALHELLVANDAIKAAIQRKAPVDELRAIAVQAGMATLVQDGIQKVLAGDLDLAQVMAVCSR